ncbi:MAG: ATP synthase F1 subunit epsilon [Actinomycetota bacterium]|nr:ATP synthase F1 subunit epsilon [Actinomycetota bacterium]
MALDVALVSPERILFTGEADMVVCRTSEGEIAFLTDHAPFVGALGIGMVRIILADGSQTKAAVHGGFVEVRDNKVSILSDVAELPDQIDSDRARRALEEAQRRCAETYGEDCEAAIRRARLRLDLAEANN